MTRKPKRHLSPEHKAKISASRQGFKHKPESIQKISETIRSNFEDARKYRAMMAAMAVAEGGE